MHRGTAGVIFAAVLVACSNTGDEAPPEPATELAADEAALAAERLCAAIEREPSNQVAFEEFERDFQREVRTGLDEVELADALDAECGRLLSALGPPTETSDRAAMSGAEQAAENLCRSMAAEQSGDLAYVEFEANLQRELSLGVDQRTLFEALTKECGDLLTQIAPAFGPDSDLFATPQEPSGQPEEPTWEEESEPTPDSEESVAEPETPQIAIPEDESPPPPPLDLAPEPESPTVVAMNETFSLENFDVTVRSLTQDATAEVLSYSSANSEPSNGMYGLITFDATYRGTGSRSPAAAIKSALVIDAVQHRNIDCEATVQGGFFDTPVLEAGGTATGVTACFDHPGFTAGTELFLTETLSLPNHRVYVRFR